MRNVVDLWLLYIFFLVTLITGCEQRSLEAEINTGQLSPDKDSKKLLDTQSVDSRKTQGDNGSEQQSSETEEKKQKESIEGASNNFPIPPHTDKIPKVPQGKGVQPVQSENLGKFPPMDVNNLTPPPPFTLTKEEIKNVPPLLPFTLTEEEIENLPPPFTLTEEKIKNLPPPINNLPPPSSIEAINDFPPPPDISGIPLPPGNGEDIDQLPIPPPPND